MYAELRGWCAATAAWVDVLVNAAGKLIIDPSEILEEAPTNGEVAKAPTSNWAYDHAASPHGYTQGACVTHSANQSIAFDTWTILANDSEDFDTDIIHDTVTNNSRLTCKTAGKYLVGFTMDWAGGAAGRRCQLFYKNGVQQAYGQGGIYDLNASTEAVRQGNSCVFDLAVNDYMQIGVYQTSGGALNLQTGARFWMQKVG